MIDLRTASSAVPRFIAPIRLLGFATLLSFPFLSEFVAGSYVRVSRFHVTDWLLFMSLALGSLVFWASGVSLIAHDRKSRALAFPLALVFGLMLGGHKLFYSQFASVITGGFLDAAVQHGFDVKRTILGQLPTILLWVGIPTCLAFVLLLIASPPTLLQRTRRRYRFAAVCLGLIACPFLPENTAKPLDSQIQHSLSEVIYRRATFKNSSANAESSPYLPPIHSNAVNILFIFSESLRHDAYCVDPSAPCEVTPYVHKVMRDRVGLTNFRSNASWTVISTAVVTTGLPVTTKKEDYSKYPNLFEIAKSAGRRTEYLGSQKLKYLYLRTNQIDKVMGFSDLSADDAYEYADEDLANLALERLSKPSSTPYFVMLQFGDTHSPYSVDPKLAPFAPYSRDFSWEGTSRLFNQYRNSIYRQDHIIGQMLEKLMVAGQLDNTIVLFTADHGEAFREHTTIYHGGSVLEEEIHVPGWIWASARLRRQMGSAWDYLRTHHDVPHSHLDLVPTMLDFMGVFDEPSLRTYVQAMPGLSLLRDSPAHSIPISNCSDLLACAFRNFGLMSGKTKLEAREWDGYWNCWDIASPISAKPLPMSESSCQDLLVQARKIYPTLPNGHSY
jgi:glucan phosphoethanolaminetransferase (alkaline phosphatase superfamily)